MRRSLTTAAAMAATLTSAQDITDSSCVAGLFMLVARGTNEDPGPGALGTLAERIADRIDDSEIVALDYPATFTDPLYPQSVVEGTDAMREAVRNYTDSCPDGKIAVFGYSQGAHVASNVFCGGSDEEDEEERDDALPKDLVEDSVISIVLFGDPSHRANATYNEGTSDNDGLFERSNITVCEDYSFLKSYCDTGDIYCDSGDIRAVHGSYLETYGRDVVQEVLEAWNNATNGDVDTNPGPPFGGSGSGTVTPMPTETPTPGTTPGATTMTTSTETSTETETQTGTQTGSETGSETGGSQGGGDNEDAAVGLSAAGSLMTGAPLMLMALWNVL